MKVLVLTADANTLIYHRGDLIRDFASQGCEVVTAAAGDYPHVHSFMAKLQGRHVAIRMARSSINPLHDLLTVLDMWKLFRREKPDILFAYTIKSVCYGAVLARLAGIRRIYTLLPGMGLTFVKPETWKGRLVAGVSRWLHRIALKCSNAIFVQNVDDLAELRASRILPEKKPVQVTAGSGVNLEEFPFVAMDNDRDLAMGRLRFALVSRLLTSKGVKVFAEAARSVKSKYPGAEFHLIGPFDPSPNRVTEKEVAQWVSEGLLVHHGMVRDVASLLKTMHVFVLPTWYREGVPHATLEALSMGRPVITTDSVGARETVALTDRGKEQRCEGARFMEGYNGILVPPRDVDAVRGAMEWLLENPHLALSMGRASRQLAEDIFDVREVNQIILQAMGLKGARPCGQTFSGVPQPAAV
jgi:glycosyltransferase involved in cell wall biosynthesis